MSISPKCLMHMIHFTQSLVHTCKYRFNQYLYHCCKEDSSLKLKCFSFMIMPIKLIAVCAEYRLDFSTQIPSFPLSISPSLSLSASLSLSPSLPPLPLLPGCLARIASCVCGLQVQFSSTALHYLLLCQSVTFTTHISLNMNIICIQQ